MELFEENSAINCRKKKEAKKLLKYLKKQSYTWEDGELIKAKHTYFCAYRAKTCYSIDTVKRTVSYADTTYYLNNDYVIKRIKDIKY